MTINDITELTVSLLTRYYDNDIQPFLDHCHDDILWLGPAKEQMIRTKRALIEAFEKEEHQLKFKVYNMTATPLYISANCTEVLLTFIVDTFWPDGNTNSVYQRINFTWEIKKDNARIRVCNISNPIDYDDRDTIYPVQYLESHPRMTLYMDSVNRMFFKGKDKSILYTNPEQIFYMESIGNHTNIYMDSQIFECTERLSSINKRITDMFLRCHSSYLVNPLYVKSIERFSLTMTNGKKIPVPEKKYTAVKAMLLKSGF